MSLTQGLAAATTGLAASARMAEVVSANLANSLTDGYGRRSVLLSASVVGSKGVTVDAVMRHVDRGILTDRRSAGSAMAGQEAIATALSAVETGWSGNGSGDGILAQLSALETALVGAVADPSSTLALGQVTDRLKALTGGINGTAQTIQVHRQEADRSIADQVATLNRALQELEVNNAAMAKATYRGEETTALQDSRQQIIDRIAAIVPVREMDRAGGQIALVTTGGEILIDGKARVYGFAGAATITADMSLADGSLSGLTRDGQALQGTSGYGLLGGGALEAAFALRDDILTDQARMLDSFAADLVSRFAAADPSQGAGLAGLLTDGGSALSGTVPAGLAGRLQINAAIDPAKGGDVTLLRSGLGTTAAQTGDATQLIRWRQALTDPTQLSTGGPATDVASHAGRLAGLVGHARLWADETQVQAAARWSALRESELGQGVDRDAELQTLMQIEQAYAANARVISTLDDMFATLLGI